MKNLTLAGMATRALLLLGLGAAMPAQAELAYNITNPISLTQFISCAGETVSVSGDLHFLFTLETDASGGSHITFHGNSEGLSGVGLSSGTQYRAVDVFTQTVYVGAPLPVKITLTETHRFVGQGAGNDLWSHYNIDFTINANGNATASVTNFKVDCG